jgi:fructose-1,6-bisphosphatase/inositol monophosphatase family enzyme
MNFSNDNYIDKPIADPFIEKIKDTAISAARAAGEIQLAKYGQSKRVDRALKHDLKIEVDGLCERVIIDTIKAVFPDHYTVTEEGKGYHLNNPGGCFPKGGDKSRPYISVYYPHIEGRNSGSVRGYGKGDENESDYVWIVDPLDGTVNFFHGIPYFCTSVACYYIGDNVKKRSVNWLTALGEPVIGVVYAPILDELFVGLKGFQATRNGLGISAGDEQDLGDAIICMSFGSSEETMQRMERLNSILMRHVRKVRILGSTALDMVNVACGRVSGLLQGCVRNWDFAAARIVLEQSGGLFHAREISSNQWEIVASTSGLYQPLTKLLNDLWAI